MSTRHMRMINQDKVTPAHEPNIHPEMHDLTQEPIAPPCAVLVQHDGPVTVQEMPTVGGSFKNHTLTTTAVQILGKDPRRKRIVLYSKDQAFWVGSSSTDVNSHWSGYWPAGKELPLYGRGEYWAASDTATSLLTVITENWAD